MHIKPISLVRMQRREGILVLQRAESLLHLFIEFCKVHFDLALAIFVRVLVKIRKLCLRRAGATCLRERVHTSIPERLNDVLSDFLSYKTEEAQTLPAIQGKRE